MMFHECLKKLIQLHDKKATAIFISALLSSSFLGLSSILPEIRMPRLLLKEMFHDYVTYVCGMPVRTHGFISESVLLMCIMHTRKHKSHIFRTYLTKKSGGVLDLIVGLCYNNLCNNY